MAKKKSPNDLYWESLKKDEIRKTYSQFLVENNMEKTPDSAALFSIKAEQENMLIGTDLDKRSLIIYLAGALPYMYD
jgi:hypothetical protein